MILTTPRTPRTLLSQGRSRAGLPETPPATESALRDLAFVLRMTERVKASLVREPGAEIEE